MRLEWLIVALLVSHSVCTAFHVPCNLPPHCSELFVMEWLRARDARDGTPQPSSEVDYWRVEREYQLKICRAADAACAESERTSDLSML